MAEREEWVNPEELLRSAQVLLARMKTGLSTSLDDSVADTPVKITPVSWKDGATLTITREKNEDRERWVMVRNWEVSTDVERVDVLVEYQNGHDGKQADPVAGGVIYFRGGAQPYICINTPEAIDRSDASLTDLFGDPSADAVGSFGVTV